jgi:hypothetical protein
LDFVALVRGLGRFSSTRRSPQGSLWLGYVAFSSICTEIEDLQISSTILFPRTQRLEIRGSPAPVHARVLLGHLALHFADDADDADDAA